MTDPRPAPYAENHSALTPLLVMLGFLLWFRNWPTGIRIDDSGIRMGAVTSSRAADGKWLNNVTLQAWGLFTCPWEAVESIRVVTDRTELKELGRPPSHTTMNNRYFGPKKQPYCMTGVLSPLGMRAALVIRLDLTAEGVQVPHLRHVYFYNSSIGRRALEPWPSWEWVVPTRHPERVRAALERFGHRIPHRPERR